MDSVQIAGDGTYGSADGLSHGKNIRFPQPGLEVARNSAGTL